MSKLCIGTFLTILYKMKASGCKQKDLVGTIMHSRFPQFNEEDNSQISHIIHGDINPPNEVRQNVNWLTDKDCEELVDYFKTDVVSLLNPNKFQTIRAALIKVILEDESIEEDTIINRFTKKTKEFIGEDDSPLEVFLTGIFLYVLQFTDNNETRKYVNEIDKDFFDNLNINKNNKKYITSSNKMPEGDMKKAKEFCIKYENEIEMLPLCQIAVNIAPLHKFVREMYNEYNMCDEATQNLILKLKKQRKMEFKDPHWMECSLKKYCEMLKEYNLSNNDYFYEGAKYFHRAFERYSKENIEDNNPYVFNRVSETNSYKNNNLSLKTSIGYYISDYMWIKNKYPNDSLIPPLDYMWGFLGLGYVPENEVTFWMCRFVISSCEYFIPAMEDINEENEYDEKDLQDADLGSFEHLLNTQEDMYLCALFELYKLYCINN